MAEEGTTGPEVLVELARGNGAPLRTQLEGGLRAAIRAGRLDPGSRLPASRVLARDLGVSRRPVVDGSEQGLALLAVALGWVLGRAPRIGVEAPGMPRHRFILEELGAEIVPVEVDGDGLRVARLAAAPADAVLATPAHQSPTGVA